MSQGYLVPNELVRGNGSSPSLLRLLLLMLSRLAIMEAPVNFHSVHSLSEDARFMLGIR